MTRIHALAVAGSIGFAALMLAPTAHASEAIAKKAGCAMCHARDKKLVGPSYDDIAAKYKADASAPATLAERVRKGGKGVWGQVPMTANGPDKISDADLKAVVAWILKP